MELTVLLGASEIHMATAKAKVTPGSQAWTWQEGLHAGLLVAFPGGYGRAPACPYGGAALRKREDTFKSTDG